MAYSQSVRKSQVPVKCNLCENEAIKWKCEDCGLLLCTSCRERRHSKIKNAQNHKIIDIKQVGVHSEEADFSNIKCEDHSGQLCCLFCTNCDSLVCSKCVAKSHYKHNLIEISEGFSENIEKLKERRVTNQTNIAKLAKMKEFLEQCKSHENEKYAKVMHNIHHHGIVLNQAVDKYIEKLKKELSENQEAIMHSIDTDLEVIVTSTKEALHKKKTTKKLIKATDIVKFFRDVRQVNKSIDKPLPKTQSLYSSIPKFVPAKITQRNVGMLKTDNSPVELSVVLNIISEYQIELSLVSEIISCPDKSIWISSNFDDKLMKVKPKENKMETISCFDIDIYGMAVLPSNDILLSTKGSTLKQLSISTGKITDTAYDVTPLGTTAIHITSDNKVVVGGYDDELGRRAVFAMNEKGEHETVYELDQNNQPIFNYPVFITSTSNGNIHVADCHQDCERGRVVVLGRGGDIINTYTGHTDVNKDEPFRPYSIITTPRDNVMVVDEETEVIHILNKKEKYWPIMTPMI